MAQRQGYTMSVIIDGTNVVCVKRINATDTVQELDITSSCADRENNVDFNNTNRTLTPIAFENVLPGLRKVTVTIEGDYDAGGAGDPPDFKPGDWIKFDTLQFGYTYNGAEGVNIFLVAQFDYTSEVRGVIGYTARMVSDGQVTRGQS